MPSSETLGAWQYPSGGMWGTYGAPATVFDEGLVQSILGRGPSDGEMPLGDEQFDSGQTIGVVEVQFGTRGSETGFWDVNYWKFLAPAARLPKKPSLPLPANS